MSKIYMICVDDEPEVLEAVERDLSNFEDVFPLETASSAAEVRELLKRIESNGDSVGVIFCDHVMPRETGVELLCWMESQSAWNATKKVLLTGQAGHEETIAAVNRAGLDFYVSKPWTKEALLEVAKSQLTKFVVEIECDVMPYLTLLDTAELSRAMRKGGLMSDT